MKVDKDGSVKFKSIWKKSKPKLNLSRLNSLRTKLYQLGLIGVNSDGVGFGNISQRRDGKQFIITGTGTGKISQLNRNHYTLIHHCDIKHNIVTCEGPINASSESMSHGTIYEFLPKIKVVIHVHHHSLWKKLINKVPTTSAQARYGTPELASEIKRLIEESDLKKRKIFVTAGHIDGVFSFGKNIQEAEAVLLKNFWGASRS